MDYIKKYAKKHKISIAKAKQLLTKRSSLQRISPLVENHDLYIRKIRGQLYVFKGNKILNDSSLREVTDGKYYVYVNGKLYKQNNVPVLFPYDEPMVINAYPELQEEPIPAPIPILNPPSPAIPILNPPPVRPLQVPRDSRALYKEKKLAKQLLEQYHELQGTPFQLSKKQETKKILADKLLTAFHTLLDHPHFLLSQDMQELSKRIQPIYFTLSAKPTTKREFEQQIQSVIESESPDKERLIEQIEHDFFAIPQGVGANPEVD
jgi:hypothetical protein